MQYVVGKDFNLLNRQHDTRSTVRGVDYPIPRANGYRASLNVHRTVVTTMIMKRITVIGSSGSGKSTLSRALGRRLDLPVIHLDKHYWHPGWVGTPYSDWRETVQSFVESDEWIIDGNYRSTLDLRLQASDTIIFLDLPRWVCIWRAMKRRLEYRDKPRPDMARGCREQLFDPNFPRFLLGIWDYPNRARPDVLSRLSSTDDGVQVVWLRSTREVNSFLNDPHNWPAYIPAYDEEYLGFIHNPSER